MSRSPAYYEHLHAAAFAHAFAVEYEALRTAIDDEPAVDTAKSRRERALDAVDVAACLVVADAAVRRLKELDDPIQAARDRVALIADPIAKHEAARRLSVSFSDERTAIARGARVDGAFMVWPDGERYPRRPPEEPAPRKPRPPRLVG